jgi:DNA-binding transcriptional MocR family regulator
MTTRSLDPYLAETLEHWRGGRGPLYERLAAALRAGIERGTLLPGTRLPPERVLSAELGVGRTTAVGAYEVLRREGLVERRQGSGTMIRAEVGTLTSTRAAELSTSLQRNVMFRRLNESPDTTVDLVGAHPTNSPELRGALADALSGVDVDELAEHPGYEPLGHPPLRRAVARHMTRAGLPTDEQEVLITSGAQQAISLAATCYVEPGQLVVLEDPTFAGAIDAFRMAGARILTVPVREDGTDVAALAATLGASAVRAVYLMPTFHNPTGALVPEESRRRLAMLARSTGVPIIEDNTLAEISLSADPPPPIAAFARDAPVLTIGSLSKLFWGGLRIGWIRGPKSMIAHLRRLKAVTDLGSSLLAQVVATALLERADEFRDLHRRELREDVEHLAVLLERDLPDWTWRVPEGGLSIWARLPHGSATELAHVAHRLGVAIVPGPVMSPLSAFDDYVRLPLGQGREARGTGMERLARAWTTYRDELAGDADLLGVVV